MPLKIAFFSYLPGQSSLNSFGGLEQRYTVNWAEFLKEEGHEVHFFIQNNRCDSSFDLFFNAPLSPEYRCEDIGARKHVHLYFSPDVSGVLPLCSCVAEGECYIASPYREDFLTLSEGAVDFTPVFAPLPYMDHWRPANLSPGFERSNIMWANKGSLDPKYGPENKPLYPDNSVALLKALVRFNKKVDFKIIFMLDYIIRRARPEYGVQDLISQLKDVERIDALPWTDLVRKLSTCKINTHAGGLTSAINESLFVNTVPLVPKVFGFFKSACSDLSILPEIQSVTEDEIYERLDRLWFDKLWYNQVVNRFEEMFVDHRSSSITKAWSEIREIVSV